MNIMYMLSYLTIKKPLFYSLRSKFILSTMVISLISLLITSIFSYIGYSNILNNKISDVTETLLSTINWNLSIMVNDVRDISNIIQDTKEVQQVLSGEVDTQQSHFEHKRLIRNLVTNITTTKEFINMVYFGNENYEYFQQSSSPGESFTLDFDHILKSGIYEKMKENNQQGVWLHGEDLNLPGNNLLVFARPIINLNTLEEIGILIVGVNESVFETMLNIKNQENSTIAVASTDYLMYSSQKSILQDDILKTLQTFSKEGNSIKLIGEEKYLVNYITNQFTQWKIIAMMPYDSVMKETNALSKIAFALIGFSLLLSIFIAITISNRVTRQFRMITQVFDDINCKRPVPIFYFNERDEIGQLGIECVKLFRKNEELNKNLYEAMIKEKEAELMVLQAQINPHFLYNTLDSIFWMAETAKCHNISKMVLSLSKIFRLSLNNGQKITTIKKEMEHINFYLEIQNLRYRGKFDTIINIDPNIVNKSIIRLIVQPIVENSIYHGLEPKPDSGLITINGALIDNVIHITVSDDGIGFDSSNITREGYALRNIDERIKLFYGNEYGITVESKKQVGTTVTIRIPTID